MKAYAYVTVVTVLTLASGAVSAQDAKPVGNAEDGAVIAYSCLGCHGIDGYRNAYPSYRVPKLGGQKAAYVEGALLAYQNGQRKHPTMMAQGGSLTAQDIADVTAWFARFEAVQDQTTADKVAGIDKAGTCVACHGVNGAAVVPTPPTLSGQHQDYLINALYQYKNGDRTGNLMVGLAAALTDEDIEAISLYYSTQSGLYTTKADE